MLPRLSTNRNSGLFLSSEDVTHLLTDTGGDTRAQMSERIATTYTKGEFSGLESVIAEQIFRLLLRDTEVRVRQTMSEQLKRSNQIPHDIIIGLARDIEEVSLPVLEWSEILTDADLVDIVRGSQAVKPKCAISRRKRVSPQVTDALLESGHSEVARELVQNPGAALSVNGLRKIVEEHSAEKDILNALAGRSSLPISVVEKLITRVTDDLAQTLQRKYQMSDPLIREQGERTRESATLELLKRPITDEELDKLIKQLIAFNRLTPSILIHALCQGNLRFFEMSLATLSRVPVENARKLIRDRGELGFKALYDKASLPDGLFNAVKALVNTMNELRDEGFHPARPDFATQLAERTLTSCDGKEVDNLSYIISLVRRG